MNILDFQAQVKSWVERVMGLRVAEDHNERCRRFMEEAAELVQAGGMARVDAIRMVNYVYSRPVGRMDQEAGGACVTLAALCSAYNINLDYCASAELDRIEVNADRIREKHNAKADLGLAERTDAGVPG